MNQKFAKEAWIKSQTAAGHKIPKPISHNNEDFSGKFLMRVPKELHASLVKKAKKQGISLNQYVLYLIAAQNAVES